MAKVDETNNLSENIKVYKYRIGSGNNYDKDQEKGMRQTNSARLHNIETEDICDKGDMNDDEDAVFAMTDDPKVEYSLQACPKLLLKGRCWQRDCKYSHKTTVIDQEKDRLLHQWTQGKEQKKSAQGQDQKAPINNRDAETGNQMQKNSTWQRNVSPREEHRQTYTDQKSW